jgi:competence ComEA-like helix-hairpin-helix protein
MVGVLMAFGVLMALRGGPAAAQDDGKALVERACTKCHALTSTLKQRNTRAGWSAIVDEMVARGAEISDTEIETIIGYLAKNFGPKVKVNKATARELASALDIPMAIAEAIVEYREKHGSFKGFEDLKKAPALDGKNIDDKKERLNFAGPQ